MSKRIITQYRKIDPWGVEAAKVAPYIAERHPNNKHRQWILAPVHAFLPGHDWQNDEAYLKLTHRMSGEEIEFAKAWVRHPQNKTAAVREIYPRRLVQREEYRRACIISKRLPVIDLRDYLLGLYLEERRRTDKLRVTPEQILCELENIWLAACRSTMTHDRDRVERLGKFLWAVRTGVWARQRFALGPTVPHDRHRATVGATAKDLARDTPYNQEELTSYLENFVNDSSLSANEGRGEVREPILPPAEGTSG